MQKSLSFRISSLAPTNVGIHGGGGGIRTLVTRITGKTVFETAAFNHSATPPRGVKTKQARRPALELTGGESGI